MSGQVYVTSPQYLPSYENMMHMESILENSDNILAVSPAEFIYEDNSELAGMIANDKDSFFESTNLNPLCTMYKVALLSQMGGFDEELLISDMTVKDLIFRAVLRGIMSVQSERAVFLVPQQGLEASWEGKLQNKDRKVLKAKWNMNYFNANPNWNLISMIKCDKDAKVNILEVGCDCGANLLEIKRRFRNAQLFGVEINEDAVAIASKMLNVKHGNIEEQNIEFGGTRFDYIIFGDVLEHLHSPEKTIAYCRFLLNPKGRIIASIPNVAHYSVIYGMMNGNFTYSDSGLLDRTHI